MKIPSTKDIARTIFQKYRVNASISSATELADLLVPMRLRYHILLQEANSTVTNLYYIESGLLRISHINEVSKDELVDGFVHKGEFFVPTDLFTDKPAVQVVKTIEPTVAYVLPYDSLKHHALTNADFNDLMCAILEEIVLSQQAYNDLLSLSPREKYVELQKNRPYIPNRCPMKDVANYLRIRPETLSRIRTSLN